MVLTALLTAALLAPPARAAQAPAEKSVDDKILLAPAPTHWFKTYSLSPYREFWNLDLSVKSFEKDVDKVRAAFAKEGGVLTQPIENFPVSATDRTQQLSYRLSGKAAKAVLKRLRKLGMLAPPIVRPSMEPVPLDEVKDKLRRLQEEKDAHRAALAGMPSVSALVEEAVAHLATVRAVRENSDTEVLANLTVRQPK